MARISAKGTEAKPVRDEIGSVGERRAPFIFFLGIFCGKKENFARAVQESRAAPLSARQK